MRAIKTQTGFTIVETLIVLAVSGMIFVSTAVMIRGQVARYQYRESMTQLGQLVQSTIRDTENGYFPSNTNATAGTDSGKTLQGKRVTFCNDTLGVCNGVGNLKYKVESLKGDPVNQFTAQSTDINTIPGGLRYLGYYDPGTATKSNSNQGFNVLFSNLLGSGNLTGAGGNVFGATIGFDAQAVKLYKLSVDGANAGVGGVNAGMTSSNELLNYNNGKGLALCFLGQKRGSLTIGRAGSLSVDVNYDDSGCAGL